MIAFSLYHAYSLCNGGVGLMVSKTAASTLAKVKE